MSLFNSLPGAVGPGTSVGHNGDWRIPYLPHPGFCGSDRRRLPLYGGAVCIVMMLAGQNVWVALYVPLWRGWQQDSAQVSFIPLWESRLFFPVS